MGYGRVRLYLSITPINLCPPDKNKCKQTTIATPHPFKIMNQVNSAHVQTSIYVLPHGTDLR